MHHMDGWKREEHCPKLAPEGLRLWRCFLFGLPESEVGLATEAQKANGAGVVTRSRVSREKALEVLAKGGRLSQADYLRCRVRYFTDGAVLGTREFVDGIFEGSRELFHEKRETGARTMRGLELAKKPERLYTLRQLHKEVFG